MKKWLIGAAAAAILGGLLVPLFLGMSMVMLISGAQQSTTEAGLCAASWQGDGVTERALSSEQLDAAATIYAAALETEVGPEGALVGIATALQESDLGADPSTLRPNSDGDIGLFQQRAYVGWYANGTTVEENIQILLDHAYQARVFFLGNDSTSGFHIPGLVDIPNWRDLTLTQAAQKVQVSAFPDAYAKHEPIARSLVTKLAGGAAGQILCSGAVGGSLDCPASGLSTEAGLQPDALRALRCIKQNWPQINTIGGKRVDADSDHHTGNAIDPMIPNYSTASGIALGTEIAEWAQANAEGLGITYIIWRKQLWSVQRASEGWRTCGVTASCYSGSDPSAAHLDHVHLSFGGAIGTGIAAGDTSNTVQGEVALPVAKGSYRLTARFNQAGKAWSSGYHTGLDFAAAEGTTLYAVTAGTITSTPWNNAYGNLTTLQAADGTVFYYAHQSARSVKAGQTVKAGQAIGKVGNTGNSFGAHLHFEVRVGGKAIDPETWLTRRGVTP